MGYHDELLEQAVELVHKGAVPKQADLRRAVSSAYYALFHLLISEATANWSHTGSRDRLGRMFEHATMKKVSGRIANPKVTPFAGEDPGVVAILRQLAEVFAELQDQRHSADYDNSKVWTRTDALKEVKRAEQAFTAWQAIRTESIAQDYLVSLLIKLRD